MATSQYLRRRHDGQQRHAASRQQFQGSRATGSGSVTLNGGTLASGIAGSGGNGSINGNIMAGTGAHIIAPGGVGTIGTLSVGGITSSSMTTFNFDLGAPVNGSYSGDLINLGAGGLTVNGGTISFGTNPTALGDYRLFGGNFGVR